MKNYKRKFAMKKLNNLMLVAAGCLAFASCSDDDSNGNNVSADLTGTYELTSYTVANAQDYDNDGDSSKNLVTEGSCQAESWIQFHSNGTYDESISHSVVSEGGANLTCETTISSGTYTQDGDNVTTTRTSGNGALTSNYTFNASSKVLTRSENDGSYSGRNAAGELWANLTGNLNLTFTKVSDGDNDSDIENGSNSNFGLIGNFDLAAFIVGQGQDLDDDGEDSFNLLNESNCYGQSNITFNSDGTYDEEFTYSVLSASGLSFECETVTRSGTYDRDGDTLTTTDTSGSVDVNTTYEFNSATNTISRSDNDAEYPGLNTATSLWVMLTGNADLEYQKD
jgi:hypothetical protein